MNKALLIDWAEVLDSLRVFPRIVVVGYLFLFAWSIVYFSVSYFHLPAIERTVAVTAFTTAVLTVMAGAFPFVLQIYVQKGRNWDNPAPPPSA